MKTFLFILLYGISYLSFGQITYNPSSDLQNIPYLTILKVEITDTETLINMRYVSPYKEGGWICANKEFYINGVTQLERKKLVSTLNIPICDEKYNFTKEGQFRDFQLIFPKLEPGIEKINIVEGYGPNQFNFYGVNIKNPAPKKNNEPTKNPLKASTNNTTNNQVSNSNTNKTNTKKNNNTSTNNNNTNINNTNNQTTIEPEKEKLNFGNQKVGLKDSVNVKILFDKASDVIANESMDELQKLLGFLKTNPSVVIELTGHTEADEADYNAKQRASNLQLSIGRVNSVREFLIAKGIPSHRIQTKAYGGSRPISQDAAINRRVMMRILKY
jgi:outer membrane protein OmpA-like peptidoglycan-associated protein